MQPTKTNSEKIIEYIQTHGSATNHVISENLDISKNQISGLTSQMASSGKLVSTLAEKTASGRRQFVYHIGDLTRQKSKIKIRNIVKAHLPSDAPIVPPIPIPPVAPPQELPPLPHELPPEKDPEPVLHKEANVETASVVPLPEARVVETIGTMIHSIATNIADEIIAQIHIRLSDRISGLTETIKETRTDVEAITPQALADRIANATAPPKLRKTSVLVVGLLPAQAGQISNEFGDCFDLRFWKDESMEMLKHGARGADLVVTFTSKIGHSAEDMIKAQNTKIIRCPGGMTQLRNKLTSLYVKDNDAKLS